MSGFSEFTMFQKILFYFSVLILIIPIFYIIIMWSSIPSQIPSHFDAAGQADAWNSKTSIIVLIVIQIILFIIMTLSLMMPKAWNFPVKLTENNAPAAYRMTRSMLCWMTLIINLLFSYIDVQSIRCAALGVWFLPVTLGVIAAIIIYYIIRIVRLTASR